MAGTIPTQSFNWNWIWLEPVSKVLQIQNFPHTLSLRARVCPDWLSVFWLSLCWDVIYGVFAVSSICHLCSRSQSICVVSRPGSSTSSLPSCTVSGSSHSRAWQADDKIKRQRVTRCIFQISRRDQDFVSFSLVPRNEIENFESENSCC